ncbi:hypothetical protein [Clostridium sp.]|uniref:hypothetical protein n=1 Tax=Clostridium sp. TaxID=1506 RepID=UPI003F2B1194
MRRIIFIILAIFSLVFIGATPNLLGDTDKCFNEIENEVTKSYEFVQNGVKMEYYCENSFEDEQDRLVNLLDDRLANLDISKNKIMYKDSNMELNVSIWYEKDKTKVQVIYLNNESGITSKELKKDLAKLQNKRSKDLLYYSFIKGKVINKNSKDVQDVIQKNLKNNTLTSLNIHNGYIAKANLSDDKKINIGYMKYDTGEYLIVGTPMIFITY